MDTTKEPQYQSQVTLRESKGLTELGLMMNQVWHDDPKRLLFVLARYKFVAKMLAGKKRVLEVGCGDAFATRIVLQEVGSVCAVDFDEVFVNDIHARMEERWKFDCKVHDILAGPVDGVFDGAYSLDVLEHIYADREQQFLSNICTSLTSEGMLIIGTPSLESQQYASPPSKAGHVNCKSQEQLRALLGIFFTNVFIFSMSDEVIHTGFGKMAHYLFAIGVGKKE